MERKVKGVSRIQIRNSESETGKKGKDNLSQSTPRTQRSSE